MTGAGQATGATDSTGPADSPDSARPTPGALYAAAGALTLLSLGLPWGTTAAGRVDLPLLNFAPYWLGPDSQVLAPVGDVVAITIDFGAVAVVGAQHPMRVFALAAALLLVSAVRHGRPGQARAALLVGAAALPLGVGGGAISGPVVYTLALLLAGLGAGVLPRPGGLGRLHATGDTSAGPADGAASGGPPGAAARSVPPPTGG